MNTPSWVPDGEPAETLEENWLFRLRRERFRSRATGKAHAYYVMHLADAVNVVALTPDRKVILVEQFRAGSGHDSLETPGGLVDEGEDPLEAGARELLEETGYAGDPPRVLGTVWSNPSILSSRITTILITNAKPVAEPKFDAEEELRMELISARRIPQMLVNGQIGHALAAHGLMLWLLSEIPETPFALPPLPSPNSRRGQFPIAAIMVSIVVFALIFALLANLGTSPGLIVLSAFTIPAVMMLVLRTLDPPPKAELLRSLGWTPRRVFFSIMATIGMFTVSILMVILLAWGVTALI